MREICALTMHNRSSWNLTHYNDANKKGSTLICKIMNLRLISKYTYHDSIHENKYEIYFQENMNLRINFKI